eukprot:3247988-Pleurochrysis_carterae.AAC.2
MDQRAVRHGCIGKHDHKDEEEWETSAKLTMDNTIAGQNGHAILVDFSQIGGTANTVGTAIGAGIQWADGNLWLRTFVPPRGQANDGYHRTAYIRDARLTPDAANAKNAASFASGVLKHEAPSFLSLPSLDIDQLAPLNIKVIRLSTSFGSHELVFEPSSKCIFVSQMANSVRMPRPALTHILARAQNAPEALRETPTQAQGFTHVVCTCFNCGCGACKQRAALWGLVRRGGLR